MTENNTQSLIHEPMLNAQSAVVRAARSRDSGVIFMCDEIAVGPHDELLDVGVRVWDAGTETQKGISRERETAPVLYDTVRYNARFNAR